MPHWVKDIQSLGFVNFYRHFINNYAEITSLLICLTWKNEPWSWTTDCQVVFDNIKEAFTTVPILGYWDPESPIILETDASNHTLVAILSTQSDGEICPIAFYSRAFSTAEINYDVHNKELLAIVEFFKKWQHLLSQSLNDLGTTQDECLERTWWSSLLDSTTYLYYFTSGYAPITTQSHVLPELSMVTCPYDMIT